MSFTSKDLEAMFEEARAAKVPVLEFLASLDHAFVVPPSVPWWRWGEHACNDYRDGVYFLYEDDELLYVGKATSFAHRFDGHFREGRIPFNRVAVIPTPAAVAELLEGYWIIQLDPPMNRKITQFMESMWYDLTKLRLKKEGKRGRPKLPKRKERVIMVYGPESLPRMADL